MEPQFNAIFYPNRQFLLPSTRNPNDAARDARDAWEKWNEQCWSPHTVLSSLTDDMSKDLKTFSGEDFYGTMRRIVSTDNYSMTYPKAVREHTYNVDMRRMYGEKISDIYATMNSYIYQFHASLLFDFWRRKSGVFYEPNSETLDELRGDPLQYGKKVLGFELPALDLTQHPFQAKPFPMHAMRHGKDKISVLMWMTNKEVLAAPNLPDYKRWKRIPSHMRTSLACKNLLKGYCRDIENVMVYAEFDRWLINEKNEIVMPESDREIHEKFVKAYIKAYLKGDKGFVPPNTAQWHTKVMIFNKTTPIEKALKVSGGNVALLTHLNLLTCLQNPKTVVTQTSQPTRQQRKEAKRKKRQPIISKTLLVETETLQQINPLRAKSQVAGGQHSYQYERASCEAKKWVLKANLEVGMEIIAKKPRKSGEGHLYLVQGNRKGAVCNAHLPLKEKAIQTVKVKSFKTS